MRKQSLEHREGIYIELESGSITLGEAIKRLRKSLGVTQVDFCKAINIDVRVLSDFERDTGNLRSQTISKILTPFGLELTARRVKA